MTKRVVLSTGGSGGIATGDAALATDASGDSTKALYGDGTFKTPSGGGLTVNASVTPHAGGGQSSATQLSTGITPVNVTSISDNDSIQMPAATASSTVILVPYTTNGQTPGTPYGLWPHGATDTINGINAGTDFFVPVNAGSAVIGVCVVNGAWLVTNVNEN